MIYIKMPPELIDKSLLFIRIIFVHNNISQYRKEERNKNTIQSNKSHVFYWFYHVVIHIFIYIFSHQTIHSNISLSFKCACMWAEMLQGCQKLRQLLWDPEMKVTVFPVNISGTMMRWCWPFMLASCLYAVGRHIYYAQPHPWQISGGNFCLLKLKPDMWRCSANRDIMQQRMTGRGAR